MAENTRIWRALERTDPSFTKPFSRSGGFRGTAISPIYCSQKMTEQFGPCGLGWGMERPDFTIVPVGDEILVYCTVAVWYREGDERGVVFGVGGDKVAAKNKNGLNADDEAFKKAYTDALGNAMKQLGMSADVYLGLYDDSKYRQESHEVYAGKTSAPPNRDKPAPASQPGQPVPEIKIHPTADGSGSDWPRFGHDIIAAIDAAATITAVTAIEEKYSDQLAEFQKAMAAAYGTDTGKQRLGYIKRRADNRRGTLVGQRAA